MSAVALDFAEQRVDLSNELGCLVLDRPGVSDRLAGGLAPLCARAVEKVDVPHDVTLFPAGLCGEPPTDDFLLVPEMANAPVIDYVASQSPT